MGSGKTFMAFNIMAGVAEHYGDNVVFGWCSWLRHLLRQAEEELMKFTGGNTIFERPVDWLSVCAGVAGTLGDRGDKKCFLVDDECHHDGANTLIDLHKLIRPDMVLGLSATPYRSDGIHLNYEKVISDLGIGMLVQDGWLSPFKLWIIPEWNPQMAAKMYMTQPEVWGKSVFYFHTVNECKEFNGVMRQYGVPVEIVTPDNKMKVIDEFVHEDKWKCLSNCMLLTEGFNCVDLKTVFIRDSTHRITEQIGGRVLRVHEGTPHKNIVQSINTYWPFDKTAKPIESLIWKNEKWLSLNPNENIDYYVVKMIQTIVNIDNEVPNYLKDRNRWKSKV